MAVVPKQNKFIPVKRLYTVKESAVYLGCGVYTVRELIWSRRLPVVKFGRKQYLDIYDLSDFVEQNKKTN